MTTQVPPSDNSTHCIAIIRLPENNNNSTSSSSNVSKTKIDIIDTKGKSRSFILPQRYSSYQKICFSTHDESHNTDGLLTPCFTADGCHGDPEESCFCGLDTPHLHAHFYDKKRCDGKGGGAAAGDIGFLAQLTLHPEDLDVAGDPKIPVCDSLPKECNSRELRRAGWKEEKGRKMFIVKHDDHYDTLVHYEKTGDLHLEHSCDSCGETDLHGKLTLVDQRRWTDEYSNNNNRLNFYEVSQRPFSMLDVLSDLFSVDSDRVNTVRCQKIDCKGCETCDLSLLEEMEEAEEERELLLPKSGRATSPPLPTSISLPSSRLTRTYIKWDESSPYKSVDMRHIKKVLLSTAGIHNVILDSRHPPTVRFSISHDNDVASQLSPTTILSHLTSILPSTVLESPSPSSKMRPSPTPPPPSRSQFHIKHMCCSSESIAIRRILEDDVKGISSVSINVTVKTLYVYHDYNISATDIADLLDDFGAVIVTDGNPLPPMSHYACRGDDDDVTEEEVISIIERGLSSLLLPSSTKRTRRQQRQQQQREMVVFRCGLEGYIEHDSSLLPVTSLPGQFRVHRVPLVLAETTTTTPPPPTTTTITTTTTSKTIRSRFYVKGMCCASERPAIESLLTPLPGVSSLSINVTNRWVDVDHDTTIVTATDVMNCLNESHFGARILKDGGLQLPLPQPSSLSSRTGTAAADGERRYVESTLHIAQFAPSSSTSITDDIISSLLSSIPSIRRHAIRPKSRTVKFVHDPLQIAATDVARQLREGLLLSLATGGSTTGVVVTVTVVADGDAEGIWSLWEEMTTTDDEGKRNEEEEIEMMTARVSPYVMASGVFWLLSMLSYIGGEWSYLEYAALLSVLCGGPPIALKSYHTLKRCHFDANVMMFFASLGAVALRDYTEAAAVTFLFAISESLETRATAKARNALGDIVRLRPERATVFLPTNNNDEGNNNYRNATRIMKASAVPIGTRCLVRTGDKIPCDAIVVDGTTTVDESSLTGESRPVRKTPGDAVSGGTVNVGSTPLAIRTTALADDSAVARLVRLVEESQANRSPTERLVDEFAKRYTPLVVVASLGMCSVPWFFGPEVGRSWTKNGLITIVIACPCALVISTPVTYVAGLAAAARKGVVVKGGAVLEALGQVGEICFDKTGTLTNGEFALVGLNAVVGEEWERREVLGLMALMESTSSHPLALAILTAARNEGVAIDENCVVKDYVILEGEGLKAMVDGREVHIGNLRLFERLGLLRTLSERWRKEMDEWIVQAGTVGCISVGEVIVGTYSVADAVRNEARDVVKAIHDMNINTTMLTGDSQNAAITIGSYVGLDRHQIKAELFPRDKLIHVSKLKQSSTNTAKSQSSNTALLNSSIFSCQRKKNKLVLMCGDGVNDAPALATSDVGVAMGAGAALAMETSDVTLMDSNLHKLHFCLVMGRRVIRTINENVIFSLVVKAVVIGLTFAGMASLWVAIASDVGAMLIVTFNGMKLLPSDETTTTAAAGGGSASWKVVAGEEGRDEETDDMIISSSQKAVTTCCNKEPETTKVGETNNGGGCCSRSATSNGNEIIQRGCGSLKPTKQNYGSMEECSFSNQ